VSVQPLAEATRLIGKETENEHRTSNIEWEKKKMRLQQLL